MKLGMFKGQSKPRPHVSGYFWTRNFFFEDSASLHTYPVYPAYESATFWIRSSEGKFFNTVWIRNSVDAKSGYHFFLVQWRHKIEPTMNIQGGAERNVIASLLLGLPFQVL